MANKLDHRYRVGKRESEIRKVILPEKTISAGYLKVSKVRRHERWWSNETRSQASLPCSIRMNRVAHVVRSAGGV